jgi:hypothetical protein
MPEAWDKDFLVIVCESGSSDEVIRRMGAAGVMRYTVHRGGTGCGETGRHERTSVWPGECTTIFSCLPRGQTESVLQEMRALHDSRSEHTLGLKVFSLPARELL